jgi:hypothetical protein
MAPGFDQSIAARHPRTGRPEHPLSHLDDIIGVLEVQSDKLDYDYLQVWAVELGVSDLLKKSFTEANITRSILPPPDTHTA